MHDSNKTIGSALAHAIPRPFPAAAHAQGPCPVAALVSLRALLGSLFVFGVSTMSTAAAISALDELHRLFAAPARDDLTAFRLVTLSTQLGGHLSSGAAQGSLVR